MPDSHAAKDEAAEDALAGLVPAGPSRSLWPVLVLLVGLVLLVVGGTVFGLGARLVQLQEWIRSLGPAAPAVFVLLRAAAAVCLVPGSALSAGGALLFGPVVATICVSTGKTLGACVAFLIARYVARGAVARWLARDDRYRRMDDLVGLHGVSIVALARLFPVIPFNMQNYIFGLTRIRFLTFTFWSWLCMLPSAVIVVVSMNVVSIVLQTQQVPWMQVSLVFGTTSLMLALAGGVLARIVWLARKRAATKADHEVPEQTEP